MMIIEIKQQEYKVHLMPSLMIFDNEISDFPVDSATRVFVQYENVFIGMNMITIITLITFATARPSIPKAPIRKKKKSQVIILRKFCEAIKMEFFALRIEAFFIILSEISFFFILFRQNNSGINPINSDKQDDNAKNEILSKKDISEYTTIAFKPQLQKTEIPPEIKMNIVFLYEIKKAFTTANVNNGKIP